MKKRGDISTAEVAVAVLIIVIFLLFILGPFSTKIKSVLFSEDYTCEDSTESLDNIDFQIKASIDDKSEKSQIVDIDKCYLVGFDKDSEEGYIIRPDSCYKKSCLCLCDNPIKNKACKTKFCKYYDKNLKGEMNINNMKDLIYIDPGIKILNITYNQNAIYIKEILSEQK